MEIQEFESQIIQKSKEVPVLVDFWAPWCGPCKTIGPILEELSNEAKGKWELVKVNVDESQELAGKYGVQGIPNMKLFIDGEVAGEQTGALPKYQMEKWLEEQIPDPRTSELTSILRKLKEGDEYAIPELSAFVDQNPDFDEAKVSLAEQILLSEPARAKELVDEVKQKENFLSRLQNIEDLSELINTRFEKSGGVSEKLSNAQSLLKKGEMDQAIDELIQSVIVNKSFAQDLPRRSAVALFNLLGPDHEITKTKRRKFDMSLY